MNNFLVLFSSFIKKGGDYFLYVFATIMSSGFHFIYSIFVKSYVVPLEYGIYSTCLLLQTYMTYLQLGSMNSFNRDYPQLLGAGKNIEAKHFRDTTLTFLLVTFTLATFLTCVVLFFLNRQGTIDNRFIGGLALSAVITELTIIENFGANRIRADGKIKFLSLVIIIKTAAVFIGLYIVSCIGYYGIYLTSLLAMVIGIFCYSKKAYSDITFRVDRRLLADILISGMPLLISGLIWTIVNSIDKFVIIGFINTEALGLYAIAQNAFTYMVLIPTTISQLFYIKMGRVYGATKDIQILSETGIDLTGIIAIVVSYLCVIAFFLSPLLVEKLMPRYITGIPAAQILILGLAFYATTMVNGNILTILRKNSAILRNSVYLCILNAVCSVSYITIFGPKLENVAYGTVTAYLGATIILVYQLHKYTKTNIFRLLNCSVLPISFVLINTVFFYNAIANRFTGMLICLITISSFYGIMYKQKVLLLLKGGR